MPLSEIFDDAKELLLLFLLREIWVELTKFVGVK